MKGSYVLVLALRRPVTLTVGRLGAFHFPAGIYTYTGSALGPGGLAARLAHHCRLSLSPHWHIDYLRPQASLCEVWSLASEERLECAWAGALLNLPGARIIAPRFGASDCRCPTHLIYFSQPLCFSAFARQVAGKRALVRQVMDGERPC